MRTDAEIFQLSIGDPEAFEDIFERHAGSVLSYARRRIGPTAGEEIVSETFLVAFERRARFDGSYGSARPWLLGIATNLIRHHLRDEREHLRAIGRVSEVPSAGEFDDPGRLDAQRMRPVLTDALLSLSTEDRETFLLVAVGELTYEETATALAIPIGTVRSRVHRARTLLRERVRGFPAIPERQETTTR